MADNDVWILGAAMTKFGRYLDRDVIDLAAEATMAALADGGATVHDLDVIGAGNLMEAASGIGQRIQKQIGQTGIPVFNVANACATGATAIRCVYMAIKAGEADTGLAVGCEQMGKAGLLGASARSDQNVYEPSGRYGAVMSVEGRLGTTLMPGVFAQAGMEYAGRHDGVGFGLDSGREPQRNCRELAELPDRVGGERLTTECGQEAGKMGQVAARIRVQPADDGVPGEGRDEDIQRPSLLVFAHRGEDARLPLRH